MTIVLLRRDGTATRRELPWDHPPAEFLVPVFPDRVPGLEEEPPPPSPGIGVAHYHAIPFAVVGDPAFYYRETA